MLLLSAPMSRAGEISVKVVDRAGASGVMSRVMLSRNGEQSEETEVGGTDEQGGMVLHHTCMPGDRLFAEPWDESYYRSEKEECGESVLLRVKKRQSSDDKLVDRSSFVVLAEHGDGSSKEYVVEYDGVINEREVNLGGMSGSFCYKKLTFNLNRDVYLVEQDGAWLKKGPESSSETLAKGRTKTSTSGSCAEPPESIYNKVEGQGMERLRSKVDKDLQGVLARLRKMKGVASARLQ